MQQQRKLKNWLSSYLDYTSAQESPSAYHLWSGISVIAGMLGRECFLDQGYFKIYPNQYIIIVGDSGKYKKSTAVNVALSLYNEIEHKEPVMSRKITAEKLMENLGKRFKETGIANAFIFNSELSVFVGRSTDKHGLIDIMTEAYDCTPILNETKGAGVDKIDNTFINWIGCTTPPDLSRMSGVMVDGGLAGRVIFVASDEEGKPVSNPLKAMQAQKGMRSLRNDLVNDLRLIKTIKGEFSITDEADALHKEIYDKNFHRVDFPQKLAPYQQRKGAHLLKLAMICSAAVKEERVITVEDMETSIALLEQAERCMPLALSGMPLLEGSQKIDLIISQLIENGGTMGHSDLLRKNQRHITGKDLRELINTLHDSGMITIKVEGSRKIYKLERLV